VGYLFLYKAIRQETRAAHARISRQRSYNLPADAVAVTHRVHHHAYVDIGQQVTATITLKLIACQKTIHASKYRRACSQKLMMVLPISLVGLHRRAGIDTRYELVSHANLSLFSACVFRLAPYHPIQVAVIRKVAVKKHETADPDVRELLDDMRASPAHPHNAHGRSG
jgi:hypothetical protein